MVFVFARAKCTQLSSTSVIYIYIYNICTPKRKEQIFPVFLPRDFFLFVFFFLKNTADFRSRRDVRSLFTPQPLTVRVRVSSRTRAVWRMMFLFRTHCRPLSHFGPYVPLGDRPTDRPYTYTRIIYNVLCSARAPSGLRSHHFNASIRRKNDERIFFFCYRFICSFNGSAPPPRRACRVRTMPPADAFRYTSTLTRGRYPRDHIMRRVLDSAW